MRGSSKVTGNTATAGCGGVYVSGCGTFTMSGSASVSGNTVKSGCGGVYVGGTFTKTGGVIYGDTDGTHTQGSTENTATKGNTNGHAVYYAVDSYTSYYRDTTLPATDNISTEDTLPANVGDTLNGWTRKQ
jgi:hypothetical protein